MYLLPLTPVRFKVNRLRLSSFGSVTLTSVLSFQCPFMSLKDLWGTLKKYSYPDWILTPGVMTYLLRFNESRAIVKVSFFSFCLGFIDLKINESNAPRIGGYSNSIEMPFCSNVSGSAFRFRAQTVSLCSIFFLALLDFGFFSSTRLIFSVTG